MEQTTLSSNPYNIPRRPNADELAQLSDWVQSVGAVHESATIAPQSAYVAVFDDYITGSLGYAGKLMSVVWDGGPSFVDVFIWQDKEIIRIERDTR